MEKLFYFDYAATTPVRAEAVRAVNEVLERFGNPSSGYPLGREAADRLNADRGTVAAAMGCAPGEVYFTSGGTEADNWAIRGGAELNRRKGKHIITTAVEHAAVLETCKDLEKQGYEVTYLRPDKNGRLSVEEFANALRPDTALVSMMLVNNENGAVLPAVACSQLAKEKDPGILFHCDAVQGFMKVPGTLASMGIDMVSVSGHKIGAPKGIGALYIRDGVKLPPLLTGGGQEGGLRSGTEPTALIAGFAAAVKAAMNDTDAISRTAAVKSYALTQLMTAMPKTLNVVQHGDASHICAVTLPGYKSEVVVRFLGDRGVCVSSGSAWHKGKPSHVYAAMGLPKPWLDGMLRISFSPDTTKEEVDALVSALKDASDSLLTTMSWKADA